MKVNSVNMKDIAINSNIINILRYLVIKYLSYHYVFDLSLTVYYINMFDILCIMFLLGFHKPIQGQNNLKLHK